MPKRLVPALLSVLAGLTLTACAPDTEKLLAPLAEMARGAVTETDARVDKAHRLLVDEVAALPQVARGWRSDAGADQPVDWGQTPYVAVGVVDAGGVLKAAFPRAAEGFGTLLAEAADGPEVGDLHIVPNTFTFTVGLRHTPADGGGVRVTALLDVDAVLLDGVVKPVAKAAGGYAFLANRDHRVILANNTKLIGQSMDKLGLPLPAPGADAVGEVTVGDRAYYVACAASAGANGWVLGVLVPQDAAKGN
ncbi:MAG: hypothetical protein HZA24_06405 [Nitrospirae bacterium]|nr:hypothetical protein [Nitrospirota bacterium]